MKNIIPEKYQKYMPSKNFSVIAGITLGVLVIIFIIVFLFSDKNIFIANNSNGKIQTTDQTLNEIMLDDTDGDGVANWEEALWGTNKNDIKTFDDTPDAEYIANKKKDIQDEQVSTLEEKNLTETDRFAREFFATYASLKASGEVNDQAINDFSSVLGQQLTTPKIIDAYTIDDISISPTDTLASRIRYYEDLKTIFEAYESIGNELDIISTGLAVYTQTEEVSEYEELNLIANEYADFAAQVIKKKAPASIATYALRIANASNNTSISVKNMTKVITDPIVGLSGLSEYQKYNNELVTVVEELNATLN